MSRLLIAALMLTPLAVRADDAASPTERTALFNGKDLTGWRTWLKESGRDDPKNVFSVRDGMIHVSGEGNGYIATDKAYRDYRLDLEYRWGKKTDGGKYVRNSGVLLNAVGPDGGAGAWMSSIECQLAQGCAGDLIVIRGKDAKGEVVPVSITSDVVLVGAKPKTFTKSQLWWNLHDPDFKELIDTRGKDDVESPLGEWTKVGIECEGKRIRVFINGKQVNECYDAFPAAGQILLQSEGFEMDFRNVELRPLGKTDK
jgi:hypothetical protein